MGFSLFRTPNPQLPCASRSSQPRLSSKSVSVDRTPSTSSAFPSKTAWSVPRGEIPQKAFPSDLLSAAWRHCRTGRHPGWPSHHRDQPSECGGGAARTDCEHAGHGDRRNSHEVGEPINFPQPKSQDNADFHVSAADGPGSAKLHLSNLCA